MTQLTIAAVGDLLMKQSVIDSAKRGGRYDFKPLFAKVAPVLRSADITIGNLETTFSGPAWFEGVKDGNFRYDRIHKKTGFPSFSCPDELAPALKQAGFDVLTTANNHCMDGGSRGLRRTLDILDKHGLRHAGTYRSSAESKRLLIVEAKGIKAGILSYTYGTNLLPVAKRWMVNRIDPARIAGDIKRIKERADIVIVCVHFGKEFRSTPTIGQRKLVQQLFAAGADIVLGVHPHVLQPVMKQRSKDRAGRLRTRVAAYSLGNFVSSKLFGDKRTIQGVILGITVTKDGNGRVHIRKVRTLPTESRKRVRSGRASYVIERT